LEQGTSSKYREPFTPLASRRPLGSFESFPWSFRKSSVVLINWLLVAKPYINPEDSAIAHLVIKRKRKLKNKFFTV